MTKRHFVLYYDCISIIERGCEISFVTRRIAMKSKKLFVALIAVLMVCSVLFAFAACDNQSTDNNPDDKKEDTVKQTSAEKLNAAVGSVEKTIDALAGDVADGKFDAAVNASVAFYMGATDATDEIDVKYTLGTQASVDLLNKEGVDKAILYVKDANGDIINLYFEETGADDGIVYMTAGDVKAAIVVGNVTSIMELYGITGKFFDYSGFATVTGMSLNSMWNGISSTVAGFLSEELDEDGYITLSDNVTEVVSNLLPSMLGSFVNVDDIPAMVGLSDVSFVEMMKFVKLSLRLDAKTDGDYFSGLMVEISLAKGDSDKIPADFKMPTIRLSLAFDLDLKQQTINANINKAEYAKVHAINGVVEGEITLTNKDQSTEVFTYSIKTDLDPMAIIANGADFANFELTTDMLADLGIFEAVVKDATGKVIAEAFYNSKINPELAFAFINYDMKGQGGTKVEYYCTFDIHKLTTFAANATNYTRTAYEAEAVAADQGGFDFGMIGSIIDVAKSVFGDIGTAFEGIDIIDEQNNAIVVDWAAYDAGMAFANNVFAQVMSLLGAEDVDISIEDIVDPSKYIKMIFGDNIDSIAISLDTEKSGYAKLAIDSEEYDNLFWNTNQANIGKKYYVGLRANTVDAIDIPFGGEFPTKLDVAFYNLVDREPTIENVTIAAWTGFNPVELGEQIVYCVPVVEGRVVMIPFAVKVNVTATQIANEISVTKVPVADGVYTAVVGDSITDFGLSIKVDGKDYALQASEISCAGLDASGRFTAVGTYTVDACIADVSLSFEVVVVDFNIKTSVSVGEKFDIYVTKEDGKKVYLLPATVGLKDSVETINISDGMKGSEIAAAFNVKEPNQKAKKERAYYVGVEGVGVFFDAASGKLGDPAYASAAGTYDVVLTYVNAAGYTFEKAFEITVK